ncbi:MAG: hypothetical protein H0W89_05380, partial [Candidatus Levybacteria bacterium]|nr:hypothetical protein [Candidatus Levybacteria bacterium]
LLNRDKLFNLIRSNGFTNAYREHTHKLISIKYHQLDYIFFKDCSIQNVQVLKQPFSDHLPILFDVDFLV